MQRIGGSGLSATPSEEAYELANEDDFNKLDMSIRGEVPDGYFKQITLTFNPWSATSWVLRHTG